MSVGRCASYSTLEVCSFTIRTSAAVVVEQLATDLVYSGVHHFAYAGQRISAKNVAVKQASILEQALQANRSNQELLSVMLVDVLPKVSFFYPQQSRRAVSGAHGNVCNRLVMLVC
jgi:hypothetical protein